MKKIFSGWIFAVLLASSLPLPLLADQILMKNGDVLNGMVLSLSSNALVLKNENLGTVNLQRAKVVAIHFGDGAASSSVPVSFATNTTPVRRPAASAPAAPPEPAPDLSITLRGIRGNTNLVQQMQAQVVGAGGPEAGAKFNELLDGLSTGKIDINGLRVEAQRAADQLRELKKELGPDIGDAADSYLSILDAFLRETAPSNPTKSVPPPPKPNPAQSKP
jgi:hypothetical protein